MGLVCAPAAFGGAQRHLLSLLHHLDAALLPLRPVDDRLTAAAVRAGRRIVPVDAEAGLAAAAGAAGVGALHVNATDPFAEAGLLRAALATGLPVTATVHMTDRYARTPPPPDLPQLWAALGAVLAPSAAIAEHLVVRQGVPAGSVVHVPNGVAPRPALPRRADPRPLRVGCLARLTAQKGLDVLVDAVARLERSAPGAVEVVVAGEGREREALAERSRGLPVTWAGHADDVDAVLAGLDAYVQPSRDDALPLALLEAMASGLPCAATSVGDVADHLGGAVLLVEPEDAAGLAAALGRLAAEPALREQLALTGRERVLAGHTDEVMARRAARALGPVWGWAAPAPVPAGA